MFTPIINVIMIVSEHSRVNEQNVDCTTSGVTLTDHFMEAIL